MSLDSLDDATFRSMNDVDFPVDKVLRASTPPRTPGLTPVKVDMVVKRGVNDDDIESHGAHFRGTGHILRFIEFMDVGATNGWRLDDVVPAKEIRDRINARWPIEPVEPNYFGEVAERYRYLDGAGEIGIIASVTVPFCGACTRAALGRGQALHLPVRGPGPQPARPHALRRRRRHPRRADPRHLDAPRRPLLRPADLRDHPAAEGRDVAHRRLELLSPGDLQPPRQLCRSGESCLDGASRLEI